MKSKPKYKIYQPKSILNVHKHVDGGWFWDKYTAFPYAGCEWGCQYCYWRDRKYNPHKTSKDSEVSKFDDPFSEYIKVKENAPQLLRKALKDKPKDLIYLDNYQPIESKHRYVRKMLKVCLELGFPVFINEKSPLILKDIDILKKINEKSFLNVGWSIITTGDDQVRKTFEPKAPPVKARFEAMKRLSEEGIMTGTVFMPVLPFIYDSKENIGQVIENTKNYGGEYVLDGGLTLWGYCGKHFYKVLGNFDPDLISKYKKIYKSKKSQAKYYAKIHEIIVKYTEDKKLLSTIPRPINFYPKELQINKRIAERFYLKAREMQLTNQGGFKEWAYRKGAWALDDLNEGVDKIYKKEGKEGIFDIENIGKSLGTQILDFLD